MSEDTRRRNEILEQEKRSQRTLDSVISASDADLAANVQQLYSSMDNREQLIDLVTGILPAFHSPPVQEFLKDLIDTSWGLIEEHQRTGGQVAADTLYSQITSIVRYVAGNMREQHYNEQLVRKHITGRVEDQRKLNELREQVRKLESASGTQDVQDLVERLQQEKAELTRSNTRLLERVSTDPLTNAYSRAHYETKLAENIAEAERYDRPLSLIVVDLDHFKIVNDNYGHAAGDYVLQHFVETVKPATRSTDIFSRYGGEEFALICPETDNVGALILAQKICNIVAATEFAYTEEQGRSFIIPVTASLGVSTYARGDTSETLFRKADDALYFVKHNGRNDAQHYDSLDA